MMYKQMADISLFKHVTSIILMNGLKIGHSKNESYRKENGE